MYLKENIKAIREHMGKTQKELAEALGVSRGSLSQYETTDIKPPLDFLVQLEELSGVPIRDMCIKMIDESYFAKKISIHVQEPRAIYYRLSDKEWLERLAYVEDFLAKTFSNFKRK